VRGNIDLAIVKKQARLSTSHLLPTQSLKMVTIARDGYACDCDAWNESSTNPLNWSRPRKWRITLTACYMSSLISIAASAYSLGVDQMTVDLHAPRLLVIAGISLWVFRVVGEIVPTDQWSSQQLHPTCRTLSSFPGAVRRGNW
jgi:hypothetical protein